MEIETNVKVEYGNLKKLVKAMSEQWSVKVGLLTKPGENGKKGPDEVSENLDMAGLGAVQEFGATINVTDKMRGFYRHHFGINLKKTTTQIKIPARSWLLMPLTRNNGKDIMAKIPEKVKSDWGVSKADLMDYVLKSGDFYALAMAIGGAAVAQIQEAFASGGFGEWLPDSPITIAEKHSAMPLIKDGGMRGAVTYEVEKNNG